MKLTRGRQMTSSSDVIISDRRKTRGNVGLLQKEVGDLVTWDVEKAEVLNDRFASVFKASTLATPPKL